MSIKRLPGLMILCFFLLSGCGFHKTKYYSLSWIESVPKEYQEVLDEGNRLFTEGQYASAEAVFEDLRQSINPAVVHQARYGVACSRFMLAENRKEYLEAIEILKRWQRNSSNYPGHGDPRMLLAFFSKVLPSTTGKSSKGADSEEKHVLVRFLEYQQQMAALKKRIADLERQRGAMKAMEAAMGVMENAMKANENTARTMEAELLKLRQQIKTLETIDQEIQEKKQGISSP